MTRRERILVVKVSAWVIGFLILTGGGIWAALRQSSDAGNTATTNRSVNAKQATKITENSAKLDRLLRCLSTAKRPVSCLDRIGGPKAPGGGTGRTGRAGLSVVGAQGRPGSPGERGPRGRNPTARQIRSAVNAYCAASPCGTPPTTAQIAAAVSAYCASGACRGPTGAEGAQGQAAAPPSETQVAAAVQAFCAERDACRGTPGLPGADGQPAPQVPCAAQDPALGYLCAPAP